MSLARAPQVGDHVQSLAGIPLGHVVSVHDSAFKVRGANEEFLLDMKCFYSRDLFGVTQLVCNADGLSRYILGPRPLVAEIAVPVDAVAELAPDGRSVA
jgi:hypothetical protein